MNQGYHESSGIAVNEKMKIIKSLIKFLLFFLLTFCTGISSSFPKCQKEEEKISRCETRMFSVCYLFFEGFRNSTDPYVSSSYKEYGGNVCFHPDGFIIWNLPYYCEKLYKSDECKGFFKIE